jgi:glycosyltransferase involved in cell wall biosynthesis
VSLISTVKDAGPFVGEFVASAAAQTRAPDEFIIVDGGSTDGTIEILEGAAGVTLIVEPGANISEGRAAAIAAATSDVIAVSDGDCVLEPDWLGRLIEAIEAGADVAMGFYVPIAENFFQVCSAAVHLPQASELRETTFMPSSRSVAFRRSAYDAAGGYPDWLEVGEDMWLDHRFRETGADMRLATGAVAHWRVRPTLGATWRQYGGYARGDAIAGMYTKRHVLRFGVYAAALLLATNKWGRLAILLGGIAYAAKPVKRAFGLLRGGSTAQKAGALAGVPAMMLFTDIAKMAGYLSGLMNRRRREVK